MKYLVTPWEHQLRGIELAREKPNLALFFEMGCGKTGTTINILREHFQRASRIRRTLILGPLVTVRNWQDEFKIHSTIKPERIISLIGSGAKRLAIFLDEAEDPLTRTLTNGKIFITNYEAMEMEKLHEAIKLWQPEILICDESHRLKNHKSVRAKKVIELLGDKKDPDTGERVRAVEHVYILTGTPILNGPSDIFNQYRILDSGKTFGTSEWEFRNRYFEDINKGMPKQVHFPKWMPRQDYYEELNTKIYRNAIRVMKSECLDLPPLVRQRIEIPLGTEQRRIYNEMRRDYVAWIREKEASPEPKAVVAQLALTKALRLQQIASGFAKTEDGAEIPIKDNPRLSILSDLLEELTPAHKVIVWATFKENYRQIAKVCENLKLGYVELHGGISASEKDLSIDRFRKDDSIRVIIANQAAAGIGINLVEASYSIFYSRNFSLEQDLQAESRNHRGGSEIHSKITRVDLVAEDSIDSLILEALKNKQNTAEQILSWSEKL